MHQQDVMIDNLSKGISTLKNQTHTIYDESKEHTRFLDNMLYDAENRNLDFEEETLKASKLKDKQNLWRLYMVIVGLSFFFIFLVLIF